VETWTLYYYILRMHQYFVTIIYNFFFKKETATKKMLRPAT